MAHYINYRGAEGVETIDEADTYREAREMVQEYNANGSYGNGCYISSRCTREWRESSNVNQ